MKVHAQDTSESLPATQGESSGALVVVTEAGRYLSPMDNKQIRFGNLQLLVTEHKGIAPLARRCDVSEKYLWQILNGFQGPKDKSPRSVGDRMARALEKGAQKPYGWMDEPHVSVKVTDASDHDDLLADFAKLPPDEQASLRVYIKTRAALVKAEAAKQED